MSLIDKKGRLFGRVNLIDLLAVLLVLAMLVFVGYKLRVVNPRVAPATTPYRLVLLVEGVRQITVDELKVGLPVRAFDAGVDVGTIAAVDVQPAIEQVETADGQIVDASVPGRFDLRISIDTQAVVTEWAVRVANTDLRIGRDFTIYGQRFLVKGIIFGLEERK
ncbi:MAG: DUF4330 domain-containing protein [Chloroflexota bacterium]